MSIQNKFVGDVMLKTSDFPIVNENSILKVALEKMDEFRLGIACITNENNHLLGIITDGDIRRKLLRVQKPLSAFFIDEAINQAIKTPVITSSNRTLAHSISLMEQKQVWDLPVVDSGNLVGLLHLHSATKAILNM